MSGYVEAFILIGIAAGGSAAVLGALFPYASALQGSAIAVEDAGVRQGAYLALVRLTVVNSGQTPIASFVVSTGQVSASGPYCYSVYRPTTGELLATTCPPAPGNPGAATVSYGIPPGGAVGVVITVMGAAFSVGATTALTVTASSGAQQTVGVQVAPA